MELRVRVPSARYKAGDVVWTHHWTTDDLCQVTVTGVDGGKIVVAHDVEACPYFGAPDERLHASQIVALVDDRHRGIVPKGAEEVVHPSADHFTKPSRPDDGQEAGAEQQEVQDVA